MIYVADSTDLFYLSRQAMESLRIIRPDFPSIGVTASITDTTTDIPTQHDSGSSKENSKCACLPRTSSEPRPAKLPFEPTEAKSDLMKQWLFEHFSSSHSTSVFTNHYQ